MHKVLPTLAGPRIVNIAAALVITPVNDAGEPDYTSPTGTQYAFPGLVLNALVHPRDAPLPRGVTWPMTWPAGDDA